MLYCPFCERPIRALVGSCPHCRRPFDGIEPRAAAARPAAPARAPEPRPAASGDAGGEFDDMGMGPEVDLAFDPRAAAKAIGPLAPSLAKAAAEVRGSRGDAPAEDPDAPDFEEVDRLVGIPRPRSALGAPVYAVRALRKLPALRAAAAHAAQEALETEKARLEAFAAWSRRHAGEISGEDGMRAAIEAAARARAAVDSFLETHRADFLGFRDSDEALDREAGSVGQEKARLGARAGAVEGELRLREEDHGRVTARLRRTEIEIRNLERLTGGAPGPESPHASRRSELEEGRGKAAVDGARLATEVAQLREELARIGSEVAALDGGLAARRSAVMSDPKRLRLEEEKTSHERTLLEAAAGIASRALDLGLVPAESDDWRRLEGLAAVAGTSRKARLLREAAVASVDRGTITRGIALAAGGVVLLIALLVLVRALH